MILETEIDGLLYSLDTDEQVATVKKCMDRERQGEVIIPASFFHQGIVYRVTSIGMGVFFGCKGLTAITLPEGVTSIDGSAFWNCSSLAAINIPMSVTSIGNFAFTGCSNLTAIVVAEENKVYDSRGGCNAIIETNTNTLIQGCSATIIPESVTSIGKRAFSWCSSLTAITIPEGVTSIGERTFYNCSSLTDITLPEGVTSIGDYAFSRCNTLTAITIPKSVTSIGTCAFSGCSNLTAIVVAEENKVYDSRGGCNAIIETNTNTLIQGCSATIIPESVTSIGECAFFWCSSLTAITIPEGVTNIGWGAFKDCSSLTDITLPEGVTSIGNYAFSRCSTLTAINIPKSVTNIGECAFAHCSSLTAITIPDGVTSIGASTFGGCTSLTTINIQKSVTSIGSCAFSGCTSLTGILIPKGVTSIGKEALKNTGITYFTILGKPTIDEEAFDGCGQLTDIYCYSEEVPTAKDNAYSGLDLSRITLHVPERALKAYKNTEPWSRFGTIVAIK